MKKFRKLFGITTLAVVIRVSIIGCDNGATGSNPVTSLAVLDAAITAAETARDSAVVSTDGSDVAPANKWVTQAEMTALENAINTAKAVRSGATKQTQVNNAVTVFNTAVASFNRQKKAGTQSGSGDDPESVDVTVNFTGITDETINLGNVNELSSGGQ